MSYGKWRPSCLGLSVLSNYQGGLVALTWGQFHGNRSSYLSLIQWRPFIARFIIANILKSSILISLHYMLPFELTKDTPYLALSGELWSVFYEYFNRNWSCYKGFLLYEFETYNFKFTAASLWHQWFKLQTFQNVQGANVNFLCLFSMFSWRNLDQIWNRVVRSRRRVVRMEMTHQAMWAGRRKKKKSWLVQKMKTREGE